MKRGKALACCAALVTALLTFGNAQGQFRETVIDAGFLVEHAPLHGRFDSEENSFVIVAGRDDNYVQQIAIYQLAQQGELQAEQVAALTPGPEIVAFDVGRMGQQDTLVFIAPGKIMYRVPETGAVTELVAMNSLYAQARAGQLVARDFFRDLNDDGLDDLLVPDLGGHRVRLQLASGGFGEEVLLQESVAMTLGESSARFEPRSLYLGDANFDGLADIITWRGDAFHTYLQQVGDRFSGTASKLPLHLGLPTEAQMRALELDQGAVDQSTLTTEQIWSVSDYNSDGLPDILTEATLSKGVFDKRNEFRVHLGREEDGVLTFATTEDALLDSKGLQFGLVETDLDGDGKKDFIVRKVRMNFGRVIGALLSGSVSLQIQFFKMTDADSFPEKANFETKTKVKFSMTSGQIDIPAVRVADFDGDGIQDLLIETRRGSLELFRGEPTPRLFANGSQEIDVPLPRNGELLNAADINGDGTADVVIRYSIADGDAPARSVRLLLFEPAAD